MSDTSHPRLLSFTLDGWTVLGGQVSVSLLDRVGVLVGRNGAGKSAILEGFEAILSCAIGGISRFRLLDSDSIPKVLDIEISTPTERRLMYRYEPTFLSPSNDEIDDINDPTSDNSEESRFSWNECCQYIDGEKEILWTTKTGVTTLSNGSDPITAILGNTSSLRQIQRGLNLSESLRIKLPQEMQ